MKSLRGRMEKAMAAAQTEAADAKQEATALRDSVESMERDIAEDRAAQKRERERAESDLEASRQRAEKLERDHADLQQRNGQLQTKLDAAEASRWRSALSTLRPLLRPLLRNLCSLVMQRPC